MRFGRIKRERTGPGNERCRHCKVLRPSAKITDAACSDRDTCERLLAWLHEAETIKISERLIKLELRYGR